MNIKIIIKKIIGAYDFDKEARRLIKKSIKIYNKGGKIWLAIVKCWKYINT